MFIWEIWTVNPSLAVKILNATSGDKRERERKKEREILFTCFCIWGKHLTKSWMYWLAIANSGCVNLKKKVKKDKCWLCLTFVRYFAHLEIVHVGLGKSSMLDWGNRPCWIGEIGLLGWGNRPSWMGKAAILEWGNRPYWNAEIGHLGLGKIHY